MRPLRPWLFTLNLYCARCLASCHAILNNLWQPVPDFSIGLWQPALSVVARGTSSAETVSIIPYNEFSGCVWFSISGLAAGATTSPAFPLRLAPRES